MAKNSHFKNQRFLHSITSKNNKGLSTIVVTLLLIALSMAAVVIVWTVVNNLIKKQIGSSESCFGNYNKITINKQYTCFEKISDTEYRLLFSLSVGDVIVDKVIVSVSSASAIKSYEITNTAKTFPDLIMHSGIDYANVILPAKNSGLTYNATLGSLIDSIQIAPVINGNQCDVSDSISQIEDCSILV